ncbi:MAG: SusD/RagB family nutrient-binding outer membrane lipoprotein [Reichenbachiella sp.]|uniref:SusD/RagB family nutrient-binding outer membrane lipoprotein n=1 Tax=Reichenbachiella sp. TaxID=2184521 RepID=UPI003298E276
MKLLFKILTVWVLFTLVSCTDKFGDININPNALSDVEPEAVFSKSVHNLFTAGVRGLHYRAGAQYAHFYVGLNVDHQTDIYKVDLTGGLSNSVFEGYYKVLRHSNEVRYLTEPGGEYDNPLQYALGSVISLYAYATLTDAFGSVPYTDGGWGRKDILQPTYDDQETIYKDIIEELGDILAEVESGDPALAFPNGDPVYQNDLSKWAKFINSFRLRLAMRMRFVDAQYANPVIVECISKPLMENTSDNLKLTGIEADISLNNPWYDIFQFFRFRMGEKIIDQLQSTNDPRLPIYAKPNEDGDYIGMPNGLADSTFPLWDIDNTSEPTDQLVGIDATVYLMTSAEMYFLRSEAALFGITSENSNTLYRLGIGQSLLQWDVSLAETNDFLLEPSSTLSGTQEEQFEQISTQLWIAMAPNFGEAYSNIRRTGYPRIPQRDGINFSKGDTDGYLPSRLVYPLNEQLQNPSNYEIAVEQMNGDDLTGKVWWDVRD